MRIMSRVSARWIGALAILTMIAVLDVAGILGPIDRALMDTRFRVLDRPASGDIVIVQIDPYSLRELDVWPWPRRYHADLIDKLVAADVREIAIDIDLSARSTEADDLALAAALTRAHNRIVLPAFRQTAAPEARGSRIFDTLPRPEFSEHAQVGSINVSPAPDGLIRRMSGVHSVGPRPLPALFALLAGPAAINDTPFYIDYGIDPNTIPRISYVDVLRGNFAAGQLAGKTVIVGTTAAELGDTLPVPVYRSMAGPAIQALAFESVRQGRAIQTFGSALSIPVSALVVVLFTILFARRRWRLAVFFCFTAMFGIEALAIAVQAIAPIALTTAPWLIAAPLSLLFALSGQIETQARQILEQRETIATRRALMDSMVENSFDGIVIADHGGRIQVMNKAAEAILRCSAGEAIGLSIDKILPDAEELAAKFLPSGDAETGQDGDARIPRECTMERRGGDRVAIELTVGAVDLAPVKLGRREVVPERVYRTLTFRDISERKATQAAQQLAVKEALAANRAKTEFLANMSHELRTPLNAIIGFSDTIRCEVFGPVNPPRYGQYIDDIHDSGTHLLQIISDILDVSRIELGQFEIEEQEFDPAEALASCAKIAAGWPGIGERRDYSVELPAGLPFVRGDERVIKQVVINLLSNAFKYSRDGDRIVLSAKLEEQGTLAIVVKDTGIGIAPQNMPDLTTAFYQVEGAFAREGEGVGLGLFLCSSYVKLHGGEFSIDSELDAGTTVTVRLPAERLSLSSSGAAVSA